MIELQFLERVHPKFCKWFAAQAEEIQGAIKAQWDSISAERALISSSERRATAMADFKRLGLSDTDAAKALMGVSRVGHSDLYRFQKSLLRWCADNHGYDFT